MEIEIIDLQNKIMDLQIKDKKPTPQAQKDAVKRYYEKNKANKEFREKLKAATRKHYEKNKEIINEKASIYSRQHYIEHREEKLQQVKEYQAKLLTNTKLCFPSLASINRVYFPDIE
jgi:exonuclease VII large subunit